MARSIHPGTYLELVTPVGPQRKIKIVPFYGRADTGAIANQHIRIGENPIAVIDVNYGRVVTASYITAISVTGEISMSDTGGLGDDGSPGPTHTLLAILADTGTAGL